MSKLNLLSSPFIQTDPLPDDSCLLLCLFLVDGSQGNVIVFVVGVFSIEESVIDELNDATNGSAFFVVFNDANDSIFIAIKDVEEETTVDAADVAVAAEDANIVVVVADKAHI